MPGAGVEKNGCLTTTQKDYKIRQIGRKKDTVSETHEIRRTTGISPGSFRDFLMTETGVELANDYSLIFSHLRGLPPEEEKKLLVKFFTEAVPDFPNGKRVGEALSELHRFSWFQLQEEPSQTLTLVERFARESLTQFKLNRRIQIEFLEGDWDQAFIKVSSAGKDVEWWNNKGAAARTITDLARRNGRDWARQTAGNMAVEMIRTVVSPQQNWVINDVYNYVGGVVVEDLLGKKGNPFTPLIEIYRLGCWPLGLKGHNPTQFVIFVPRGIYNMEPDIQSLNVESQGTEGEPAGLLNSVVIEYIEKLGTHELTPELVNETWETLWEVWGKRIGRTFSVPVCDRTKEELAELSKEGKAVLLIPDEIVTPEGLVLLENIFPQMDYKFDITRISNTGDDRGGCIDIEMSIESPHTNTTEDQLKQLLPLQGRGRKGQRWAVYIVGSQFSKLTRGHFFDESGRWSRLLGTTLGRGVILTGFHNRGFLRTVENFGPKNHGFQYGGRSEKVKKV